ncbi:hypothetical protein ABZ092_30460 [Streptomyces bobili]|uniref:hypothetical protein n=1 Tax=Streptomyces bobili TaxID=67280 RepID=UPI0033B654AC
MDHPMPSSESGKSSAPELRQLLTAVLEALDIPHPATVGDTQEHDRVLNDRAMHAAIALRNTLEGHPLGIEWTTSYLRERLAEHPPTSYSHYGTPRAGAGR